MSSPSYRRKTETVVDFNNDVDCFFFMASFSYSILKEVLPVLNENKSKTFKFICLSPFSSFHRSLLSSLSVSPRLASLVFFRVNNSSNKLRARPCVHKIPPLACDTVLYRTLKKSRRYTVTTEDPKTSLSPYPRRNQTKPNQIRHART